MNLGIFLSPGDSLIRQSQTGQLERLIEYYLKPYLQVFKQVIIFSYGRRDQALVLPKNIRVVYAYRFDQYRLIDVFRVFQAPGGLPAVIAKWLWGKPFVVTYGYDYVDFSLKNKLFWRAWILKLVVNLVLTQAKTVIVTTRENLRINRSVLISNGVNPDQFCPAGRRRPGLVLSVGRLEPQKNYSQLIKAVGRSRFCHKTKLVIIGEGGQKTKLLKLARRLGVSLQIKPNMAHSQLVGWYQSAAVFALTSLYEGHPKTLIEAMSCACPCLTTNFTGNPVQSEQSGLVAGSETELVTQLDRLLTDTRLANSLGQTARKLVISRYNIHKQLNLELALLC